MDDSWMLWPLMIPPVVFLVAMFPILVIEWRRERPEIPPRPSLPDWFAKIYYRRPHKPFVPRGATAKPRKATHA
jgi:hypothetical protein